jgi:hypothetical protein
MIEDRAEDVPQLALAPISSGNERRAVLAANWTDCAAGRAQRRVLLSVGKTVCLGLAHTASLIVDRPILSATLQE